MLRVAGWVAVVLAFPILAQPAAAVVSDCVALMRAGGEQLRVLDAVEAQRISRGAGVKVGLIDSAPNSHLPDLQGRVELVGVHEPAPDDHGTQVAALIAGRGTCGGVGVAPDARVLAVGISLGDGGASSLPGGIKLLVDRGVEVINLSLSTTDTSALRKAIQYATDRDVVIVAARGNRFSTGTRVLAPASIPGVVSVVGVDGNLRLDPGSVGPGPGSLAAPMSMSPTIGGTAITAHGLLLLNRDGTVESHIAGTSFSAALVTGVVALVRSRFPQLTAEQVVAQLRETATATPAGLRVVDAYQAIVHTPSVPPHQSPLPLNINPRGPTILPIALVLAGLCGGILVVAGAQGARHRGRAGDPRADQKRRAE